MTRPRLSIALTAGALACAGCAGGSSTSKPLTRAELTARANAICRRIISQVDWSKVKPRALPALVERLATLEERAATQLNRLIPPAPMLGEWRLIVDDFRRTGPEFRQIAKQVRESPGAYAILPLSSAQHERGLAAKEAGMEDCAKY